METDNGLQLQSQGAGDARAEGLLEPFIGDWVQWLYVDSWIWTVIGFAGAAIFGSRFLFQWLHSEKERRLVVPWYFWHLSFWGSCLNFIYCVHVDKAPLIVGNMFLPLLYGRNLILMYRSGSKERTLRGGAGEEEEAEGAEDAEGELNAASSAEASEAEENAEAQRAAEE